MRPIQALDPAAQVEFERLTLPHFNDVVRYARYLTRSPDDADDLTQNTYLHALRGWHTYRHEGNVQAWLFTICRHCFLGSRRRRQWLEFRPDDQLIPDAPSEDGWATGEGLVLQAEVTEAIDELTPDHRALVQAIDLEGNRYEDTATTLAIPIGTVRSRLFRARRMLSGPLAPHAEDLGVLRKAS